MTSNAKYFEIKLNVLKQYPYEEEESLQSEVKARNFSEINKQIFSNRELTKEYLNESLFFDYTNNICMKFISRMKYDKRFVGEKLYAFLMLENISGKYLSNVCAMLFLSRELVPENTRKESIGLSERTVLELLPKQILLLSFYMLLDDALHESS